jgi:biotin carboxylase
MQSRSHVAFVEMSTTGAGVRCIEYALESGYDVTLLARRPEVYHGLLSAHVRIVTAETNDLETIGDAIEAVDRQHPLDGVTTTQDLYTVQAALCAERLGLPSASADAVAGVRNKYRMRLRLAETHPQLNPLFRLVFEPDQAAEAATEWGYPIIAKPQDANDSWNVAKLGNEKRLREYVDAAQLWGPNAAGQTLSPGVLIEGYIDGAEYGVDTCQHRGMPLTLMSINGKELIGDDEYCFAEAGLFTVPLTPDMRRLGETIADALRGLELDCGVVHTECRVSGSEVKILEVNPRLTGDMVGSHMIPLARGADPIEQIVEIALGRPIEWQPNGDRQAGSYPMLMPKTGSFAGIRNLEALRREPGVQIARTMVTPGTLCNFPPRSNQDFVGRVVTTAATPEAALEAARGVAAMADVAVMD